MADLQKTAAYAWLGPQVSGGGKLVFFYSPHPKAEWPIARVYEDEWDNLPDSLIDQILETEVDEISTGAPKKNQAEAKGLLNYFPNEIPMYVYKDGNKISKKTAWEETLQLWENGTEVAQPALASGKPASLPSGQPASQLVYLGFTDEDKTLYELVSEETAIKTKIAKEFVEASFEDYSDVAKVELMRIMLYDTSRLFNPLRGATLISPETIDPLNEAKQAILANDLETFMDDVAGGHLVILDGEHARAVFKKIGVSGFTTEQKSNAEARVELAAKAWLYVDLTSKYEVAPDSAVKLVAEAYDEIPW